MEEFCVCILIFITLSQNNSVETDAYKQMLQSAQLLKTSKGSQETGKVGQIKDEDGLMAELEEDSSGEDDDDIEEAARLTPPSSERSSGGRYG